MTPTVRQLTATLDHGLEAVLSDSTPLVYSDGGSAAEDRSAHVRAASAIRRSGARLVIVQDDVNVLAVRGAAGRIDALLLPVGRGGRRVFGDATGNKDAKMDLEACAALPDGRLVAFGSGSTATREQLVVVDEASGVRVVPGRALYARLRAEPAFTGSELNVEGALVVGDTLRLFQRGNGAPRGDRSPVNATGDLSLGAFTRWLDDDGDAPVLVAIVQFDLGRVGGTRFGFTDATLLADRRVAFVACAEDSPDAVLDGPVLGCRFGLIEQDGVRVTEVLDPDGRRTTSKLEGIETCDNERMLFDVVADMDRAGQPALLGRLLATGG